MCFEQGVLPISAVSLDRSFHFVSAPLFKFELLFLLLLWFLFQDNLHIESTGEQAFLYNIHAYLLRIHPPPSTGEAMAAMDQRLPCSSTTEAKSRWTTSGSVGPKMASPKISPPGTGWGDPVVTGMIWRFDSCEMHFFVCAWMSHVYHCLDFLMLLCNSLGRLSVIPTKWNCVSFVKSIGGAESFSVTAHGFPRSVPWCE